MRLSQLWSTITYDLRVDDEQNSQSQLEKSKESHLLMPMPTSVKATDDEVSCARRLAGVGVAVRISMHFTF